MTEFTQMAPLMSPLSWVPNRSFHKKQYIEVLLLVYVSPVLFRIARIMAISVKKERRKVRRRVLTSTCRPCFLVMKSLIEVQAFQNSLKVWEGSFVSFMLYYVDRIYMN